MQIILLSGGSGSRLWPLSNSTRSKQFLKLFPAPDGGRESMLQRVVRQLRLSPLTTELHADVTIATGSTQRDATVNQIGDAYDVITEPERRGTFPAIALATTYLAKEKQRDADEVVVVLPCDAYTADGYFETVRQMAETVETGKAQLALMGIRPTYPSAKYGYIVPEAHQLSESLYAVRRFTGKVDEATAQQLIAENAYWNGGVFAFRLSYLQSIVKQYVEAESYEDVRAQFANLPNNNFDREVVEKEPSLAVVTYNYQWKDLGTWRTLTEEIPDAAIGNVILDDTCTGVHAINELEMPLLCIGAKDMVVAATADGILVSEKGDSNRLKHYVRGLERRPMYEERRWGEYKVIDTADFPDGFKTLTKQLTVRAGKNISYQLHHHRTEVWTFINGTGLLVLDGNVTRIGRGTTVTIPAGMKHAVRALTDLTFIEVQSGDLLIEEDIDRFPWEWEDK